MSHNADLPELNPVPPRPFRRAVLRGLAVLLPPLLTIVIFVWIGSTVANYLLVPMENVARRALVWAESDIRNPEELGGAEIVGGRATLNGIVYQQTADEKFIPADDYDEVRKRLGSDPMPSNAKDIYKRYVNRRYLQRQFVVPVFLLFFILILYLLGKFLAAGMGRFFLHQFESIIHRIPLIRNVYSSVKQVTDFMFSEREIEYTRVIAVEYPRKGIWSLGLVTGESFLDIKGAANGPVLSVLMPTSPMPFTGFTVTVRKSEAIDLNITIDQAFQFIVSCGVVVPPHQLAEALESQAATDQPGQADPPALPSE